MKKEEYERLIENFPRIRRVCLGFAFLHFSLRNFELDSNHSFSNAVALASIGYLVFKLLDSFARAKNPRSVVFDYISIFCGIAVIVIGFVGTLVTFFNVLQLLLLA